MYELIVDALKVNVTVLQSEINSLKAKLELLKRDSHSPKETIDFEWFEKWRESIEQRLKHLEDFLTI